MKIGIDFDRVVFDTDSFNEYIKEETGLHHVDADVYDEHGNYSPEKHAEASGVDVEKVYEIMEKGLEKFLYDDAEMLENIDQHSFVIVTRGEDKFQRAKIEASGADEFFDQIFTVQEGSKDVDGVKFLVDDREKEIERARIPGMVLDRERHSMEHVISFVGGGK